MQQAGIAVLEVSQPRTSRIAADVAKNDDLDAQNAAHAALQANGDRDAAKPWTA